MPLVVMLARVLLNLAQRRRMIGQWSNWLSELLRTTAKVKTSHVARSRGQKCGDIQLDAYIADAAGPAPLIMDLRIVHERFGSRSNPPPHFCAAWILISRSMMLLLIRFATTVLMIVTITLSLPWDAQ